MNLIFASPIQESNTIVQSCMKHLQKVKILILALIFTGIKNNERQFLFAGATLPPKIKGLPPKQYLKQHAKGLKIIQSENLHKFGEGVDFQWIFTDQDHE